MFNLFHRSNFARFSPEHNNVLLVETNGCHGEVIAAYVKYFQQLNMNVYCLVNNRLYREKPFARLNVPRIFSVPFRKFHKLMTYKNLGKYDHIFVMSSVCYNNGLHAVADLFPDLKRHKSVYYVHHNTPYIAQFYQDIDKKHNIALGRFRDAIYINPHLFGDYVVPKKDDETVFISVGGINPNRKNHTMLMDAIEQLSHTNRNFRVLIIGSGKHPKLPPHVKRHIQFLGHLDYDEMYNYIEQAHFFLPLLDAENPDHDRYIETQVTGSAQLIYGFRKIPVIHEKFADFYDFTPKNAILYQDLADGMQRAMDMTPTAYTKYVKEMNKTANKIYQESFSNLGEVLNA